MWVPCTFRRGLLRKSGKIWAKSSEHLSSLARARFEIVRRERGKEGYSHGIKDTTILSQRVEEVEQQIIEHVTGKLAERKWIVTSLIHDEIIIGPNGEYEDTGEELKGIKKVIMQALRDYEYEKKWEINLIKMEVAKLD